ncbi:MAG: hypothetical protein O2978_03465, partial [Bacteroidetes bacterium]|nr:hypothetical protein [Bacteroidota bacterium]
MKKLLLLTTILVFACSSDDSSDNSNQTFLERYDGVVWQSDDEDTLTIIDNDNYSWKNVFNG